MAKKRNEGEKKRKKKLPETHMCFVFYTFNTIRKILIRRFQSHLKRLPRVLFGVNLRLITILFGGIKRCC
jgi:hypothetical protein